MSALNRRPIWAIWEGRHIRSPDTDGRHQGGLGSPQSVLYTRHRAGHRGGPDSQAVKTLWTEPTITIHDNEYHVASLSNSNWRWDTGTGSGAGKTWAQWQGYGFDLTSTRVVIGAPAPTITTTSLPDGTTGVAYNQTVASTGGDAVLVWSVLSGSLPAGLSLSNVNNQNSTISGTPTTAATSNFTLQLADVDADSDTQALSIVVVTAGVPEINVQGNGANIADGDTTPTTTDHTDFGSADINSVTVTRTYTVQNTGSATLSVGTVTISGTNAADFTVTAQPATSVAAGGSTTFSVQFDPSADGLRTASLSFTNDDADESPYDFAIQGTGTSSPEINVQGNAVTIADGDTTPATADDTDFGSADINGVTITRTYTVQNTGSATLSVGTVTISGTNAADFTVTAQPATNVAAGGSTTFGVLFDPSADGLRTASLSFSNGDADENPYDFAIQGTGTSGIIVDDGDAGYVEVGTWYQSGLGGNGGDSRYTNGGATNTATWTPSIPSAGNYEVFVTYPDYTGNTTGVNYKITSTAGVTDVFIDQTVGGGTWVSLGVFNFAAGTSGNVQVLGKGTSITVRADAAKFVPAAEIIVDDGDAGYVEVGTWIQSGLGGNGGDSRYTNGGATNTATWTPGLLRAANYEVFVIYPDHTGNTTGVNYKITSTTGVADVFIDQTVGGGTWVSLDVFNFATGTSGNVQVLGKGTSITVRADAVKFVPTTAPEIDVLGNGSTILDGDTTPSIADDTDFGSADINGVTVTRTYTIQNTGSAALTVGTVTKSGTNAADFTITVQPASSVAAGGNTTFSVQFNLSATGRRTASLSFSTNDANENPYNFSIQGTGTAIGFRAASSANSGSASVTSLLINKPTGVVSGDFMLAGVSVGSTATITPPSGWTLVRSISDGLKMSVYRKLAGASEPSSYTWSISTSSKIAGGIVAFSSLNATTPIQVENGVAHTTATSKPHTTPTIATTGSATWLVSFFGDRNGTGSTWTPPSGATERVDTRSTGTSAVSVEINSQGPVAAGNKSHTATASVSSAEAAMEIVALQP
ncbi:MAG: choice-of-anchor D domain-containing protein [Opitutaceae bacterium]|nr:choice-of-anchor D domain-containing protein [Opitutaceae bacterium]